MDSNFSSIINSNSKPRKNWIDSLRAFAIIFVVLIHSAIRFDAPQRYIYNVFTGPIMLPLFFAISGYLFNTCNGNFWVFLKKLTFRLIIPWIFLSLIWFRALMIPLHGYSPYFTDYFYKFISGETLWYFSCCIIAELIQFFVQKFAKKFGLVCLIDVICSIIGFVLAHFNLCNFLNINKAFIAQFYLMLGFVFKNKENFFSKLNWKVVFSFVFGYISLALLSLIIFPEKYIDVNINMYPNVPYYLVFISVGIFMAFMLAKKIDLRFAPLVFIGQNTLFIYSMHWLGFIESINFLSVFGIVLPQNWIGAIFLMIFAIMWCLIVATIVNKFIPFAVGRKRK